MEIGPISEWVTAIAEVLAVVVALFLPYYEEQRKKRLRNRNLKLLLKRLTEDAMKKRDSEKLKNLESFLKLGYWIDYDGNDEAIYMIANQILLELKSDQYDSTNEKNIRNLLIQLELK
ncbi:MAG: hypothetical protein J6584_09595 [Lactobacillus sp.]|nr:hypothetical protein [Lactobacillus sp.]